MILISQTFLLMVGLGLLYLGRAMERGWIAWPGLGLMLISVAQGFGWIRLSMPAGAKYPANVAATLILCAGFAVFVMKRSKKSRSASPEP